MAAPKPHRVGPRQRGQWTAPVYLFNAKKPMELPVFHWQFYDGKNQHYHHEAWRVGADFEKQIEAMEGSWLVVFQIDQPDGSFEKYVGQTSDTRKATVFQIDDFKYDSITGDISFKVTGRI
ncbi:hypothetical protein [Ruegeria arenilitoris]|uniref:hypothetical protein n=1 Tax=Ruegeria arenilitoris TaxID=1173585 RepID=UPI00147ED036|nr:hypothetical protein [Ruegeria arenilitoris]